MLTCEACGVEAPTKYVAFYQNIGALILRFHKSIEGQLCKSCIHKYYWEFTAINLLLGWWGMISFVITPFFLLNNTVRYVMCLGMPAVPEGAARPELTDEAIERLRPHVQDIFAELGDGRKLHEVAAEFAPQAGVTPGQVALFVYAVARSRTQEE